MGLRPTQETAGGPATNTPPGVTVIFLNFHSPAFNPLSRGQQTLSVKGHITNNFDLGGYTFSDSTTQLSPGSTCVAIDEMKTRGHSCAPEGLLTSPAPSHFSYTGSFFQFLEHSKLIPSCCSFLWSVLLSLSAHAGFLPDIRLSIYCHQLGEVSMTTGQSLFNKFPCFVFSRY